MLHPKSGIGEHTEVSADKPEVLARIRTHLRDMETNARYVTIPFSGSN